MKKALIVAAHPDDDILGCGGILSKFKNKVDFKVLFIGEGTTCRFCSTNSKGAQKEIKARNSFAVEALNYLNVFKYTFHNLPCGRFDQVPQIEINKIIESEIHSFQPDTIFTHSDSDSNKDHAKVYDATIISTRPPTPVNQVLSYEVLSSTEWGFGKEFLPNTFIALNRKDVQNKWNALEKYKSETKPFPYPRSEKGINALAQYRGLQSGSEYAESFKLIRRFI